MKKQLFLTLFLMFLVVFGGITLLAKGDELWKKDYTKTDEFYALEEDFVNGLIKYLLNPFDSKQAEQQLTVTDGEVDYYRHYYGTKEEQLQNVMAQYENREETEAMIAQSFVVDEEGQDDVTGNSRGRRGSWGNLWEN